MEKKRYFAQFDVLEAISLIQRNINFDQGMYGIFYLALLPIMGFFFCYHLALNEVVTPNFHSRFEGAAMIHLKRIFAGPDMDADGVGDGLVWSWLDLHRRRVENGL